MRIRRKGREWGSLDVGATTYVVRLEHVPRSDGRSGRGCATCGQWTAVALAPVAQGERARVAAVSTGAFRAATLRLLRERLAEASGRDGVRAGGPIGGGARAALRTP